MISFLVVKPSAFFSTGSSISNVRVVKTFIPTELGNKDDIKEVEIIETIEEPKKEVSLKEIDEEILTIDDFLDDFKF